MKRKIGSVLLALVLTLVLLPTAALAEDVTWTEIDQNYFEKNFPTNAGALQAGHYKLTGNVTRASIIFYDTVTLDLNGFQLKPADASTCLIRIYNDATLTLIDSSDGKTGKIVSEGETPVLGITVGGKLYAHGVTISGNVTNHGQIFGGTFEGKITGSAPHVTGSGTEADPYKIYTADGLKWFRDIVNGENGQTQNLGACAVLEDDIDLGDVEWTPIGISNVNDGTNAYSGIFDGKGYTISGLNVTGNFQHAGLFGITANATIQNLSVSGSVSAHASRAGGIVGSAAPGTTIKNCSNHCNVTTFFTGYVGGVTGVVYNTSQVIDCYNTGLIKQGTSISSNLYIGGIAGSNDGTIRNCYNVGSVSCDMAKNPGSITGLNNWIGSGAGTINNCYYLDSAGLNAVGKNNGEQGTVTNTDPKSKTEFADGTVLNLLMANRPYDDQPWDSKCRLVDAVNMKLPVFKYQAPEEPTPEPVTEPSGSRFSYSTISASAGENGSISPSGDLSVRDDLSQTFVFTPDKGYRVKDVLIDGQSVGALRSYTFATVRRNRTVEVIFEKIPAFVDVPAGSYYEDAVNWAVENWITDGTSDAHFSPDAPCTRAQAVTFLWRAAGCPAPSSYTMPFADVKSGSYYETAVLWALENNIVSGTSETTFEPDAVCTRAQIVCFLFRYKAANGMDAVTLAELLGGFADSAEIPAYASPALNWAISADVLQGSGAKLLPNEACTRAQIVTLLYRTIR